MRILRSIASSNVLIILDGLNDMDNGNLDEFLGGEYAVLITTTHLKAKDYLLSYEINYFKKESDQLKLFTSMYTKEISDKEKEDIISMIRSWEGHTKGICLLATTMRDRRISPSEMRALLESNRDFKKETSLLEHILTDLQKIFYINDLDEDEMYIMKNLSLLPEAGISTKEFINWTGLQDYSVINSLIDRCLIEWNDRKDSIHLHSILVDIILPTLSDSSFCQILTYNLFSSCDASYNMPYSRKLDILQFVQSVYYRTTNLQIMASIHLDSGMHTGKLLKILGRYNESIVLFREMILLPAISDSLKLVLKSRIAHALLLDGKMDEGLKIAQEVHDGLRTLTTDNLDIQANLADNWCLQRLCEYYRWNENYSMSETCGYQALEVLENIKEDVAWDKGWSKYHLAYALFLQNKYDESEKQLLEATKFFEKIKSNYSKAYVMELLGQVYMQKERYDDALSLTVEAGKILQNFLGPNHIDYGRNLMFEGNIHRCARKVGGAKMAISCYQKAYNIFLSTPSHSKKAELINKLITNDIRVILDLWGEAYRHEKNDH